ncbi:MAG: hypothetical protein GEV28_31575 [Actinophytocola sp.]|uniref:hypothetical protein n=1 Tax=Actinophytocola sp. TaxID=1872138 RepID=UPI00132076B3|nr:hypothetical protein [Actinophytocola sp.]MPZ84682.1 hypothetical protein [Actinophytocola sp.]
MTSSLPDPGKPLPQLSRRVFVGTVATLGVATMSGTATAAPTMVTLDRAAGVARLGGTVHALGHTGATWVLVAADGSARRTRGLAGADIADLTATEGVLVAVGADDRSAPAVWESTDGLSWRRATRLAGVDGHLTAVGAYGGTALAVGARLTLERAPRQRIVLRRTASGWATVRAGGLGHTDELAATAVAGGPAGWLLSTVDATGSLLATSPDGLEWTPDAVQPRLVDAAVRSLSCTGGRVRWVANAMSGSEGVTGALGTGRRAAPVPADALAVGVLDGRSYWLAGGHLVSATV